MTEQDFIASILPRWGYLSYEVLRDEFRVELDDVDPRVTVFVTVNLNLPLLVSQRATVLVKSKTMQVEWVSYNLDVPAHDLVQKAGYLVARRSFDGASAHVTYDGFFKVTPTTANTVRSVVRLTLTKVEWKS